MVLVVGWFIFLQLIIIQCGIRIDTHTHTHKSYKARPENSFFNKKPEKSDDAILVLCTFSVSYVCVAGLEHIFFLKIKYQKEVDSLVKNDNDSI